MNITLNEMINQIRMVNGLYEDGEIEESTYLDTLESKNIELEDKVNAYVEVIKQKEGDIVQIDSRIKELQERKNSYKKTITKMKENVAYGLEQVGERKIKTPLATVFLATSKQVMISATAKLPETYLVPQPAKPDKKAIKAALESGEKIDGVMIRENSSLRIR